MITRLTEALVERVLQFEKVWGEDESVEIERVIDMASSLYGADPSEVVEPLLENLRAGSVTGAWWRL